MKISPMFFREPLVLIRKIGENARGQLSIDAASERERCDAEFWRIRELYKWLSSVSRETFNLNTYPRYLRIESDTLK